MHPGIGVQQQTGRQTTARCDKQDAPAGMQPAPQQLVTTPPTESRKPEAGLQASDAMLSFRQAPDYDSEATQDDEGMLAGAGRCCTAAEMACAPALTAFESVNRSPQASQVCTRLASFSFPCI
jgi:hypothetical protein